MNKKLLLIVPHQDDELFAGGGILAKASEDSSIETYVLFITNGDYYPGEAEYRLNESLGTLTNCFSIKESNIIFLGYGDTWKGNKHIYNSPTQCCLESVAGKRMTYALKSHPEYRYLKTGIHSEYCRMNLKRDIKDVIRDIYADILICVDYDPHPDHRATSLLFEECMGEILYEKMDYRPIVLKTFAYDGMWKGKSDFFSLPHKGTQITHLYNPTLMMEDMIRIPVPYKCNTVYLRDNFLYHASKQYKTQSAWQKADRFINADMIFWRCCTRNLLYQADIIASSGNARFVADFKRFDCDNVLEGTPCAESCAWMPEYEDKNKKLIVHFNTPVVVSIINIYALCNEGRILNSKFVFDNGYVLSTGELDMTGKKNHYEFEPQYNINEIQYQIENCYGTSIGITEIEMLEREENMEEISCLFPEDYSASVSFLQYVFIRIEKIFFNVKKQFSICFPNKYFMRKYYPILNEKKGCIGLYRIRYIFSHAIWKLIRVLKQ